MTRLSNWREESDLFEVVTGKMTDKEALKKVDEKKGIKNKVVINPKLTEAIKKLGGELIEVTEEDENGAPLDSKKEAVQPKFTERKIPFTTVSGVTANKREVGTDELRKYAQSMVPGQEKIRNFINKYRKNKKKP